MKRPIVLGSSRSALMTPHPLHRFTFFLFLVLLLTTSLCVGVGTARAGSGFQIYVNEQSGRKTTIDTESSDSIENIKEKIYDRTGYLPSVQLLIFSGEVLKDGRILADYNIGSEATLNFVFTVDGGNFSSGTTDLSGDNITLAEVSGTATVNVSGVNTRIINVSGGTVNVNAASTTIQSYNGGNVAVGSGLIVAMNDGTSSGVISGDGGMTMSSAGVLTLSGSNTYTGTTTVGGGLLVVNGSISGSAVTVQNGGTLGGSGTVGSATIESGGTIAPGNSPGTLTFTNGFTWAGGGNYNWQIYNASNSLTAGLTNTWDLINVTGGLWDITGLSSTNKFNINLWSLSGLPETTGPATGFDATQNYSWMILASVGVTNAFDSSFFNINTNAVNGTGGFTGATGVFSLSLDGNNDLFLNYAGAGAPVPEPGTWAAAALLAGGAAFVRWRRRRKVS